MAGLRVWQRFGPWNVNRYASPSNATCPRFNALFNLVHVEGVKALTQDWRGAVSFILPDFYELGKILDIIERGGAEAVLVVPEWPYQAWWRRLHSAAWARRIAACDHVSGAALIPNTQGCFFGSCFTTRLLIIRTTAVSTCSSEF